MDPKAEVLQPEEDTHELELGLQKPTLQLQERKGNLALASLQMQTDIEAELQISD
jgi:hypothetical protein